jgi:hypothetical protein
MRQKREQRRGRRGRLKRNNEKERSSKARANRDCLLVFASFSANKICRIGGNKGAKTSREREGRRRRNKA